MIKKYFLFAALMAATAVGSGCVYAKDRANDFADIFTFRAGISYGLSARVQVTDYFGAGVGASMGRKYGFIGRNSVNRMERYFGAPLSWLMFATDEDKKPLQVLLSPLVWEKMEITQRRATLKGGSEPDTVRAFFLFNSKGRRHFFPADCRIEVGYTLGVIGLDVGFNPVELADFFSGFFGADIANDDSYLWDDMTRLIRMAGKGSEFERSVAAGRIVDLGEKDSADRVLALLDSGKEEVVLTALDVLGELGDKSVIIDLKKWLSRFKKDSVRTVVLGTLEKLDNTKALASYTQRLLAECGPREPLLSAHALRILWEREDPSTVPFLVNLVLHEKWIFPYYGEVLRFIGASGQKKAAEALLPLLESPHTGNPEAFSFFTAVGATLAELGVKEAVQPLLDAFQDERFKAHHGKIAVALGRLHVGEALPEIEKRLGKSPGGSTERLPLILAHYYIELTTYGEELEKAASSSRHMPAPGPELFLELESGALLAGTARPGGFERLAALLEKSKDAYYKNRYFELEGVLSRIESGFYDLPARIRPASFKSHVLRVDNIINFLKSNKGKFIWSSGRRKFVLKD